MARKQNGLAFQNLIEPMISAPLDARQQVKLKADLTDLASYPYHYIGMVVGCREDSKLYVLVGKDTTAESNWKRILTNEDIDVGDDGTISLSEYAKIAQIPVKISDLADDINLQSSITQIQEDLANFYEKKDVYTKDEVDTIIANINSLDIVAVPTLPTSNIRTDCIYLVKDSLVENNLYSEYIYLGEGEDKGWEKFGNASIDLSDYVTTTMLSEAINDAIADLATTQYVDDAIASIESLENAVEITAEEVAALFA